MPLLTCFRSVRPRYRTGQRALLDWLSNVHGAAEATHLGLDAGEPEQFAARIAARLRKCACPPEQIGTRGQSVIDLATFRGDDHALYDVDLHPRGKGTEARTRLFANLVDDYFARAYADEHAAPDDLVHVTCTGYVSPSGAQKLVAQREWSTRVTHAYHMGCYAAMPALRIAAGFVATGSRRVDIAHTELCSLHLDPSDHRLEQLVVQSLFADGLISYRMGPDRGEPGLRVLALHERVLPNSAAAMTWIVGDAGMQMTLARDIPDRIAGALRGFVIDLLRAAGRDVGALRGSVVAVHPGGPKIIDRVRDVLELDESQLGFSRGVLFDHGNMSSATLPHVWMRIVDAQEVPAGTLVPSFAFGPGLTVCGALLEKR
ncbi:MAG TPA: 3-oxoacyl-[acyl-carrier-protein] synthase III C-terminal domain-containing protein [Kofleriaceae bacterium]